MSEVNRKPKLKLQTTHVDAQAASSQDAGSIPAVSTIYKSSLIEQSSFALKLFIVGNVLRDLERAYIFAITVLKGKIPERLFPVRFFELFGKKLIFDRFLNVFVGIGNSMRGDDGLGPAFVERLKNKVDFPCINGRDIPENYFGKIVNEQPDTVILIDAVQLFLEPGEYRVLQHDDLLNAGFSTHSASPSILMEYLGGENGAKIYMLGIQPNSVIFGV